jgi:hypothetical protein
MITSESMVSTGRCISPTSDTRNGPLETTPIGRRHSSGISGRNFLSGFSEPVRRSGPASVKDPGIGIGYHMAWDPAGKRVPPHHRRRAHAPTHQRTVHTSTRARPTLSTRHESTRRTRAGRGQHVDAAPACLVPRGRIITPSMSLPPTTSGAFPFPRCVRVPGAWVTRLSGG